MFKISLHTASCRWCPPHTEGGPAGVPEEVEGGGGSEELEGEEEEGGGRGRRKQRQKEWRC